MLHYYKFHTSVYPPRPAREAYVEREPGRGWPEQCPPIRQANSFGWDVLSNFDLTFRRAEDGSWGIAADQAFVADWDMHPSEDDDGPEGSPSATEEGFVQNAAWFWDPEQTLPHPISPHVYEAIRNQVKVSSYLYLKTDPNEVLLLTDVPNRCVP